MESVISSAVIPAAIAGIVSLLTTRWSHSARREEVISDKAWSDYELRRDQYFSIVRLINCLFAGGSTSDKAEFHRIGRALRLVGFDDVVKSLNALTDAIKTNQSPTELEERYRSFFNAMRQDIRQIRTLPPECTTLGPEAFPIES